MGKTIQAKLGDYRAVNFFDLNNIECDRGDFVVLEGDRGSEFGKVVSDVNMVCQGKTENTKGKILRKATEGDLKQIENNRMKAKDALNTCARKITDRKLQMQIVKAEYTFDSSKIIFFFTAEGRIDFRNLVKDLARVFRVRIELKQIGVRDKAKIIGGYGVCGRELCCSSYMKGFHPLSIKMAKALRGKDEFNIIIPYVRFRRQDVKEGVILLDSSAIIDGRISDICKAHFLNGRLVAARFILQELQSLADSADDIKRERGRRGLELLQTMKNDPEIDIHIHEDELTDNSDVDSKLITLAKIMDARICTTDFNLNRTATLQGIEVLNVHELVNAVKSVLFTGDTIEVKLIKEGKETHQAVGYMEDGTMIVVSEARKLIGQSVMADVTSVLQTQAGKMIFAKLNKE